MQSRDLNLLIALDALITEGSVTGAAQRLNLSPPAVSRTLGRIRKAVGDPILVRAGRRLVPTSRALALQARVRAVVEEGTALLRPGGEADLRTLERTFAIRANDSLTAMLTAPLASAISQTAPGVQLRFLPDAEQKAEALRSGAIDLETGVFGDLGPEIRRQTLFRDPLVAVVRADGRYGGGTLTLRRFAAASHISVSRRGLLTGPIDRLLADRGLRRTVVASVATYPAALFTVTATDAIIVAPERFARVAAERMNVRILKIPLDLEPIPISMAWHPRHDMDAAHVWLRREIIRALNPDAPEGSSCHFTAG